MSHAIVGFGKIGQALAHAFARKNIDVTVASRRHLSYPAFCTHAHRKRIFQLINGSSHFLFRHNRFARLSTNSLQQGAQRKNKRDDRNRSQSSRNDAVGPARMVSNCAIRDGCQSTRANDTCVE